MPIPVYETPTSTNIIKHIELELFVSIFQELFIDGQISKVCYNNNKIVAIETDGDEMQDII